MFKKYTCAICGKNDKKNNMAKTKDEHYVCLSCQSKLSRYFPGCFNSNLSEVTDNMEYMQNMRAAYEEFLKDTDKKEFRNVNLGVIFSEKYGVFKVIDNEWADRNPRLDCELFRIDQINRYEVFNDVKQYVYLEKGEFERCGVRIYMNSRKGEKHNKYRLAPNQSVHPYVYCLEIRTADDECFTLGDGFEDNGMRVVNELTEYLGNILGTTKADMAENRGKYGKNADVFFHEIYMKNK